MTKEELFSLEKKNIDFEAQKKAKAHWDEISKPLDGLGDFEKVVTRILSILGEERISLKKALVVMISDNGIVEENVSQCGQENTLKVAHLMGEKRSSACMMSEYLGVHCVPVDIGIASDEEIEGVLNKKVCFGTKNFLKEAAMSEDEVLSAIEVGIDMVRTLKDDGYNIIATGEMGIGNTTTSTALLSALTSTNPDEVTGRGAGLNDEGLKRKIQVINEGLKKHKLINMDINKENAFNALRTVGGADIASMTGVFLGGAIYGVPIVIDGLISAVSALLADIFLDGGRDYMIPSHSGREKGVELILNRLSLKSFINGDMALGEGTGALMLLGELDLIFHYFNNAVTFNSASIEKYERHE